MHERILCMYSGGIDSTGMLYEILNDSKYLNYDIHVHHISMVNLENRHEAELLSVKKCVNWLNRKFKRKILFTTNIMDFRFLQPIFPVDGDICAIVAGQIFRSHPPYMKVKYKYMATGTTKSDTDYATIKQIERYAINDDVKEKKIRNYKRKIDMIQVGSPRTNAIIKASVSKMYIFDDNELLANIPERIHPVLHMTKEEIMCKMPKELLNMTWSCRTPIKKNNSFIPCNKCKPCKEIDELKEFMK